MLFRERLLNAGSDGPAFYYLNGVPPGGPISTLGPAARQVFSNTSQNPLVSLASGDAVSSSEPLIAGAQTRLAPPG
jgi:hypothetical protein